MATELETLVVTLEASIKQYERQLAKAQGTTVKTMRQIEGEVVKGGRRASERMGEQGREMANALAKGFGLGRIGRAGIGIYLLEQFLDFTRKSVKVAADAGNESAQAFLNEWDAVLKGFERLFGDALAGPVHKFMQSTFRDIDNIIKLYNQIPFVTKLRSIEDILQIPGPRETIVPKQFESKKIQDQIEAETSKTLAEEARARLKILEETARQAEALAEKAKQQREAFAEQVGKVGDDLESATSGFVDALLDGTKASEAFAQTMRSLLKGLINIGLNQVKEALFGTQTSTGTSVVSDFVSRLFGPGGPAAGPAVPVEPVTEHILRPIPPTPKETFGALVSGTESSASLIGGAKQDLLDAKATLESAKGDLENAIPKSPKTYYDRIYPEQPEYRNAGIKEYLPLDTKETTYQPISPEETVYSPVKSAKRIAKTLDTTADVIQKSAQKSVPKIVTGIDSVAQSLSGHWGNAGGFPILNSVFGSFASIGGAYEHSIPFGGAFQHGGQFRVGGSGGTDSSLVAIRATPGELVTVTPRHLAGGRGRGGVSIGGTVINIAGNADERTVEMIDRRIAANNYRTRKALERDWGAMSMRYQQLRG